MIEFLTPRPIKPGDSLSEFCCGEESLDRWLRGYARRNEKRGASRTMVSVTRDGRVAGYYCLSASSLVRDETTGELARAMPTSIPVVLLGRLAVDREFAGRGVGYSLLQHATIRALEAAEHIGIRAFIVHALSAEVVPFYERFGFTRFPEQAQTLYLLSANARATIATF